MKKLLVGPVEIPNFVLEAMNYPSFSHRTPEYEKIQKKVENQLRKVFGTTQEIFVLTSSGTGAMEASIANCFSPGDHVLVPLVGNFSRQFAHMAKAYGLDVEEVVFDYGEAANPERVKKLIRPDTKGILLTHNESSTGIQNDLEAFGKITRNTDVLLIVDSISGAAGLPLFMDNWGIDVLLTASQKCLMSPPGLSFISLSDKAWRRVEESTLPKFYYDLKSYKKFNEVHQTPATPGIYTLLAVSAALDFIEDEGYEEVWERTASNAEKLRTGLVEMGFQLFVKDLESASDTLTTVYIQGRSKQVQQKLVEKGFLVAGGLTPYAEDTLRIGTMGYVFMQDIDELLEAMKEVKDELDL